MIREIGKHWDKIDFEKVFELADDAEEASASLFYQKIGNDIMQLKQQRFIAEQKIIGNRL